MGVNSFGMGGNNTHAIVEEYRPTKSIVTNGVTNGHTEIDQEKNNQYFIFIFSCELHRS
jgi:acyl transferase domain-containing protein